MKEIFDLVKKSLEASKWADEKLKFEEIQIDAVLRAYVDLSINGVISFADPAKLLKPKRTTSLTTLSTQTTASSTTLYPSHMIRKVSDNPLEGEGINDPPNTYIVFEICSENDKDNIPNKLDQLEKDLRLMLFRHLKDNSVDLRCVNLDPAYLASLIENAVNIVGIILPISGSRNKTKMDGVLHTKITERKDSHQLLFHLYSINRFFRFYAVVEEIDALSSILGSLLSDQESDSLSSKHTLEAIKTNAKKDIEIAKINAELAEAGLKRDIEIAKINAEAGLKRDIEIAKAGIKRDIEIAKINAEAGLQRFTAELEAKKTSRWFGFLL